MAKKLNYIKLHEAHFNFPQFIKAALAEDVGDGDHTSISTIPAKHQGSMELKIKEAGIIAGVEAAKQLFLLIDSDIKIKVLIPDGTWVVPGQVAFTVKGETRTLLKLERLVLNIMQRMSGIATQTHHLMSKCQGTKAKVIDTRKTTPGFRFFEKWAVVIGGGANHRYGLFDMILIKDNHVDFAGGIQEAVGAAKNYLLKKAKKLPIEVEVRSIEDLEKIMEIKGIYRILLDNFSPYDTRRAVKLVDGKIPLESSGGINYSNIHSYARAGVDFISIGALTHHIKSLDLSLKAC